MHQTLLLPRNFVDWSIAIQYRIDDCVLGNCAFT